MLKVSVYLIFSIIFAINLLIRDSVANTFSFIVTFIIFYLNNMYNKWLDSKKTNMQEIENRFKELENNVSSLKSIIALKR